MVRRNLGLIFVIIAVVVFGSACSGSPSSSAAGKLQVVATTSIIGDVIQNIGGNQVDLHVLVPPGADEHSFQYNPADLTRVAEADLIFMNGASLEPFIKPLLEAVGTNARVVSLADGIKLLPAPDTVDLPGDPHVWTDPNNVAAWTEMISQSLGEMEPAAAERFLANAAQYRQSLADLDAWIKDQVSSVPPENRKLVSDHQMLTYFASRYGFTQVGAIIPSYSTMAQPSAQELAKLEDAIREYGVKAIFVGNTVNPNLAERVAADTGIRLVPIYTGSLSEAKGPASSYLDYMRFNVRAIVDGLK